MPTFHVGQLVWWKRGGVEGHYLARIVRVRAQSPRPITIEIVDHEWWPDVRLQGQTRAVRRESLRPAA
jgi:hypothetical protein